MRVRWINSKVLVAGIGVMLITGCGKEQSATPATTRSAEAVAVPTTAPAAVTFTIAERPYVFGKASVVVDSDGERLLIYSDKANETGSFYFEMPIDDADPGEDGWEWDDQTPQDERQDTLAGIRLEQADQTLQPIALTVKARPMGQRFVQVELSGTFLAYPADSTVASAKAKVEAKLVAERVKQ